MKKFVKLISIAIALLAGLFFLGPRPVANTDVTFDPGSIGSDLDDYLARSEANIPNLVDGAQKQIIWNDPVTRNQTETAIVFVHGFSATRREIVPVPENLAGAFQANLYFTRLKGHGRDAEGFAEGSVKGWINDMVETIAIGERIGKRILIIASSTGGTLATWAMTQPELSKNVAGLAMISPNYEVQAAPSWLLNMPWAETLLPLAGGRTRSWEPHNEEQGKWWTTTYPSSAIFPMAALVRLVEQIDKSAIKQPALFIYSEKDQVVVPTAVREVAGSWGGSAALFQVENSGDPSNHVLAGDILSPQTTATVTARIVEWIEANNLAGKR